MYYVGPHYSNKNLILLLNLKNTFKYEFPLKNKENMFLASFNAIFSGGATGQGVPRNTLT